METTILFKESDRFSYELLFILDNGAVKVTIQEPELYTKEKWLANIQKLKSNEPFTMYSGNSSFEHKNGKLIFNADTLGFLDLKFKVKVNDHIIEKLEDLVNEEPMYHIWR